MLLSHHPPCQYDRTIKILNFRICSRCTGLLLGIAVSITIGLSYKILDTSFNTNQLILILVLFPIPAVINFTLHQIGFSKNRNIYRIITGVPLGIPLGISFVHLLKGSIYFALLTFIWYIFLEIVVVLILKKYNKLEEFIAEYEDGVYKE